METSGLHKNLLRAEKTRIRFLTEGYSFSTLQKKSRAYLRYAAVPQGGCFLCGKTDDLSLLVPDLHRPQLNVRPVCREHREDMLRAQRTNYLRTLDWWRERARNIRRRPPSINPERFRTFAESLTGRSVAYMSVSPGQECCICLLEGSPSSPVYLVDPGRQGRHMGLYYGLDFVPLCFKRKCLYLNKRLKKQLTPAVTWEENESASNLLWPLTKERPS